MSRANEALRHAVEWIEARRHEDPELPLWRAIDEASLRFDLTPADAEFLLRNWRELASGQPGDDAGA